MARALRGRLLPNPLVFVATSLLGIAAACATSPGTTSTDGTGDGGVVVSEPDAAVIDDEDASIATNEDSGDHHDAPDASDDAAVDSGVTSVGIVQKIATGLYHSCVLGSTGAVFCWGGNQFGQLGDGMPKVAQTDPSQVVGMSDAEQIGAGNIFTCVLRQGGKVACWGDNFFGQIGDGTDIDRAVPKDVAGVVDAVKIAVGGGHVCVLRATGGVTCWGDDYYGQLGDGATQIERRTPVVAAAPADVIDLAVGVRHTCALRATGEVACWGGNYSGQIGDGTVIDRASPTPVKDLTDAIEISAGYLHTCALRRSGAVLCWGRNTAGQLGDGTTVERRTPVAVQGLTDAVAISVRDTHTCAVRATKEVVCWGDDSYGQLGDGNMSTLSSVPVKVNAIVDASSIAVGSSHTCAVAAGQPFCWGDNSFGQVGDGSLVSRANPTLVTVP